MTELSKRKDMAYEIDVLWAPNMCKKEERLERNENGGFSKTQFATKNKKLLLEFVKNR